MTSAYQMAVPLRYNNNDTLSLDDLSTATKVGKDLLTQVLQPLVKSRILINDETDQYDLNPRAPHFFHKAIFSLLIKNPDFKSKKIRVNLYQKGVHEPGGRAVLYKEELARPVKKDIALCALFYL
jgi:cullin 1